MSEHRSRHMAPAVRRTFEVFAAAGFGWVRGVDVMHAGGERFGARLYDLRVRHGWDHEKRHDPTSALPMYRIFPVGTVQLTLDEAIAS